MWNHQERKKLIQLAPENIRANPAQPRQEFDKEALEVSCREHPAERTFAAGHGAADPGRQL